MTAKKIFRLSATPDGFGQTPDTLTPDMFVSELPVQHSHEYFQDEALGLYVGVWDTTDMIETAGPYPCDEFMWLLEGEATIRNCKTGKQETATAGEPFIIPRGYDCQWRQTGYLRKFFLISESPDEPIPERPVADCIIIPRPDDPMVPLPTTENFFVDTACADRHQHISYENHSGNFLAGTWESDAFESTAKPFPCNLFAHIITGALILTDQDATEHVFGPGETLFLPGGVWCSARAPGKIKLIFARIFQPANGRPHATTS